jgi:hypothetical protein
VHTSIAKFEGTSITVSHYFQEEIKIDPFLSHIIGPARSWNFLGDKYFYSRRETVSVTRSIDPIRKSVHANLDVRRIPKTDRNEEKHNNDETIWQKAALCDRQWP